MSNKTSLEEVRRYLASSGSSSLLDHGDSSQVNPQLTESQALVDGIISHSIEEIAKPETMIALLGAGGVSRLTRIGVISAAPLQEGKVLLSLLAKGGSYALSLANESVTFTGIERGFSHLGGHPSTESFEKAWARSALSLGSLKFFGKITEGQHIILQHLSADLGMVEAENLAHAFHITEAPRGTLAERMFQAEVMNWSLKGSLALGRRLSPGIFAAEKSLDLFLKSQESGLFNKGEFPPFFSQFAMEASGAGDGKGHAPLKPFILTMSSTKGEKGGLEGGSRAHRFGLTEQELIQRSDPHQSQHPFLIEFRQSLKDLDLHLYLASQGRITTQEDCGTVTLSILWREIAKGFGYVSSSQGWNPDLERLTASVITSAFMKADIKYRTLVIPIDLFYEYRKGILSLAQKTRLFHDEAPRKKGHPYGIILTGFTDSMIFDQSALEDVPDQRTLESALKNASSKFVEKFKGLVYQDLSIRVSKKSLLEVMEEFKSAAHATGRSEADAKLLLCTVLLYQDPQAWQGLYYENRPPQDGTPLYIVAPQSFHDAMNRLNEYHGHGAYDYRYRANHSLGGHRQPLFDLHDGKVILQDELEHKEYLEKQEGKFFPDTKGRISPDEFLVRVGPIVESL